jgi:HPt (histidine-containing phosphotransfer) domain-containing protein
VNEKIRSIALTFCSSASAAIAVLEQRKPPADEAAAQLSYFKEVRDVSHRLAGTSRTLGFEDFSSLLLGLEAMTRSVVDEKTFAVTFAEVVEAKVALAREMAAALRPEHSKLCRT